MLDHVNQNEPRPTATAWELLGSTSDHIQTILDRVAIMPAAELAMLPRIRLHNLATCDTGGIFRVKINEAFDYLLHKDDLFTFDTFMSRYMFAAHSHVSLQQKRRRYQIFGKILYWYVIIHQEVPFPTLLDPTIFAFCVYGYIPVALSESENPAFATLATQIRGLDINPD